MSKLYDETRSSPGYYFLVPPGLTNP